MKVIARAIFSSSSSDEFEILADDADTEESDAPTDPELGRADYWTCIKCKNQKNNPLYRFCEKCFQVNPSFRRFEYHMICVSFELTSISQCIRNFSLEHDSTCTSRVKYYYIFVVIQFEHVTQGYVGVIVGTLS